MAFVYSVRSDHVDVLYSNIQNTVFHPCKNDMIVLAHLHLRHPILVETKKFKDI
jgi:nucleosome binding factor SPN SPT16 subunit